MRVLRWVLLLLYVLLVGSLFLVGLWLGSLEDRVVLGILLAFTLVTQALFLLLPGRPEYLTPVRPRRLVVPIIIGGVMMTLLLWGLVLALAELFFGKNVQLPYGLFLLSLIMWIFWALVFYVHCSGRDRLSVLKRVTGFILGGSLLQLMATVPSHLIVIRRPGCLVGGLTATGIFAGVYVAIWSFGPGIILLFWMETRRRMAGHCPKCGYYLYALTEPRCPECGRPFTFAEIRRSPEEMEFSPAPTSQD